MLTSVSMESQVKLEEINANLQPLHASVFACDVEACGTSTALLGVYDD